MKKVVAIGGGTGLSTLLRGIRDYDIDITAVVTMTDNGASSGILRKELRTLPPGDVRQCIAALSADETAMTDLFQYRFKKGFGLAGHSLGNLIISALKDMTGNFETAIEHISHLLGVKGQVLPASLQDVHLVATFDDGKEIIGETEITKYGYKHKIEKLCLTKNVKANPKVLKAIEGADFILIGPGSFYTSLIPNLLIKQIREGIEKSGATKVYICNVSTERGETDSFSIEDHEEILNRYGLKVDKILANSTEFPAGSGDGYIYPVKSKLKNNKKLIFADLLSESNFLYHDSHKLGKMIWSLIDAK